VQGGADTEGAAPASDYVGAVRADVAADHRLNGGGVTVALLDTGVSPVADLGGRLVNVTDDLTGHVSPCVNFAGDGTCDDGYGHGTFLAGIIAGDGAASGGRWTGVAPAARVLSVKVAGRGGAADVSTVLAAIQWVVSFKDRYGRNPVHPAVLSAVTMSNPTISRWPSTFTAVATTTETLTTRPPSRTFWVRASTHRYLYGPASNGRSRNSVTFASSSPARRDASEREIPSIPIARTKSSTRRVDAPPRYACAITDANAC
jgi:subtilisin family serine protease